MKFKNQILPFAIAGLLTLGFTSCSDDDGTPTVVVPQVTIGAFVQANPGSYSSLYAALEATDLLGAVTDETANLTVFAPDNDAFATFLSAKGFPGGLADVDTDEEVALVKNILLNHVIGVELKASDVVAATASAPFYGSTLAEGPDNVAGSSTNISIFINSDLEINGQSTITGADAYDASNGIIHAVDTVIDLPNLTTFATADTRVSVLAGLLTDNGLVDDIMGLTTATVLAPVNAAFDNFAAPAGLTVAEILQYHVINGVNAVASDAIALTETPDTLQGETIAVEAVDGAPQFTGNGNTSAAAVVIANIQASNGVIHVIDTALLPEIPQVISQQ